MENTVENPVVASLGNSWIICRSKSHRDRIYYFNTYTGEAAWNLNEIEIEKAKKATKIFENSGVNMDGCPEPKDPPQDNLNYITGIKRNLESLPKTITTKTCNNQTICEKPKETHFAPFPFRNQCCNHMNTMSHIGLGYPMAFGLNPKVWNVPDQQIPSNISPIINMSPYQMDLHQSRFVNNELAYVQSTTIPLNKRFETLKNVIPDNSINSLHRTNITDFHENILDGQDDLRNLISRKKHIKYSKATDEPIQLINKSGVINDKTLAVSKSTDTIACNRSDVADDSPIIQDKEQDSTLIKKNVLLRLKNIAKRIHQKDLWYIVPDVNTILYHQDFLKSLVEADEECRLMVLENVMTEIRNMSRSDKIDAMNNARRAMYYISQSIRAHTAIIAKNPAAANIKSKSYILDCCIELSEANYHIILLCNDKELHGHEKAACIPMFTVGEMKSFVKEEDIRNGKDILHMNRRTRIKGPNNEIESWHIDPNGFKVKSSNNESIQMPLKIRTVSIATQTINDFRSNKTTVDIGIQANLYKRLTPQTRSTQTIAAPLETNTLEKPVDTLDSVKRKEIKLIRSISSQSAKKEDTQKRNFKWRRKRIVFDNRAIEKHQEKSATENQCEVLASESICMIDSTLKQPDSLSDKDLHSGTVNKQNDYSIKETSTLSHMFNTQNNLNSEIVSSENVNKTISNVNNEENINSNCFMFEITSPAMEESLKTRCDEWVSRFLQIMEEVLTQLLQKDSSANSLTPPWTVHEATQCIKVKYYKNSDIVDAADKLSEILFSCSDFQGKIDINIKPEHFMKLYSYAVYLIDSLQVIVQNSEDLQIAAESMAKLLNEIQNPSLDNSQNDSFTDITLETALDASSVATSNTDMERNYPGGSHEDSIVSSKRDMRSMTNFETYPKYNLRSQWKRTFQNNMEDILSPRAASFRLNDPESQFFTSLHLRKNDSSCTNDNTNTPDNASTVSSLPAVLNTEGNKTTNNDPPADTSEAIATENNVSNGPRIIRNFTVRADFEAKIRSKESETVLEDLNKDNCEDDDFMGDDSVDNREETNYESEEELQDEETKDDRLKYVISTLVREIRESFLVIYAFCEESQKRLKGPNAANDAKRILKTAEEIHFNFTQLFGSLHSIQNRDATEMKRLFAKFCDSVESNDLNFNEDDFQEYRDLIGKCIDQGNLLRDSVECIMRYAV